MPNADDTALIERLATCDQEIAAALNETQRQHTPIEQLGILIWELDWRSERELILAEMADADEEN